MNYKEFTDAVQKAAQLQSEEQTVKAIEATLTTLSERVVGKEASELAAQLPEEIGAYLRGREGEMGERFSLEEFYKRVSDRAGVSGSDAASYAKAIFATLNAAVSAGEYGDIKSNLPPDYQELVSQEAAKA
jgi:uncharacterized protein (DUF2267 family)